MPEFVLDHGTPESARQSSGQLAYEEDCRRRAIYHDGTTRKVWSQLRDYEQDSWHRNPTPRDWVRLVPKTVIGTDLNLFKI